MELVKKNIHMDYTKASACSQFVLEEDLNLSDVKPDIDCICLEKGHVLIDEVRSYTDSATVRGRLIFAVLYHTDEDDKELAVMEGRISFEEKVHMQGIDSGDSLKAEGTIEDLSIGIINSRKLSVQSVVNLCVKAEDIYDEEVPIGIHSEEKIEYRRSPMEIAQIAINKNDIFRVREEINLPGNYPNIFQILWSTLVLDDVDIRPLDGKLSIQGDLRVLLIYESDEGAVRSLESTIPFSGNIECYGCQEGMIPDISYHIAQQELSIRPDNDGEERVVSVEALLELGLKLYEESKAELITDVYGVTNEVNTVEKKAMLRSLLAKTTGKQKVAEHIRITDKNSSILQLLHSEGKVLLDSVNIQNGAITMTGSIQLQILYVSGDDRKPYDVLRAQLPYKYEMEIPGIGPQDMVDAQAALEQLQVTILDGEELDVKAVLVFRTTAFQQKESKLVRDINATPLDTKKLGSLPSMAIYVVKPGDNLWSIGKRYYLSVDRLKKLNDLTSDELRPGQKLLIVKEGI